VAQVVECLLCNFKVPLSSNPGPTKNKTKKIKLLETEFREGILEGEVLPELLKQAKLARKYI
jgi:hypothetical protein